MDIRDAFFIPLRDKAISDPSIIFLSDDFDVHVLKEFAQTHPSQFINVGAQEANCINVAAGLAMAGKKVYVIGIASFITSRCFEQIKVNLVSMKLPVTIVGVGPGFSFSNDGPTHHGLHDYALMNMLNPMEIFQPVTEHEATETADYTLQLYGGPAYIRLDKGDCPKRFGYAGFEYYLSAREPDEKLIIVTGKLSFAVLDLINKYDLSWKYDFLHLNRLTPTPFPFDTSPASRYKKIYVIEENIPTLVHEVRKYATCPVVSIAAKQEEQLKYGSREYMLKENGLDEVGILKQLL